MRHDAKAIVAQMCPKVYHILLAYKFNNKMFFLEPKSEKDKSKNEMNMKFLKLTGIGVALVSIFRLIPKLTKSY